MVVPDVMSLTSVADNFDNACAGLVDTVCKNPLTNVAKCIHSEADVCKKVEEFFYILDIACQVFQEFSFSLINTLTANVGYICHLAVPVCRLGSAFHRKNNRKWRPVDRICYKIVY